MRKVIKKWIADIFFWVIGCFIYSSAVTLFISSNEISPGGITGIATALGFAFKIPSGILLFLFNIPILVLGFVKFGGVFIIKTSIASVLMSVALTITDLTLPSFSIDKILAAIFGGILMGIGISLIMLRGATTGGIDIIAKLINRKHRHLTFGRLILIMDGLVIIFAAFIYRNIESALYSVIAMYATSYIMDMILYGSDKGKVIYIVTEKPDEICKSIGSDLKRGVTVIHAKGGYTGNDRTLLLSTVRRHEVSALYTIINKYDPKAFIIVADAGEIIGEGFKNIS